MFGKNGIAGLTNKWLTASILFRPRSLTNEQPGSLLVTHTRHSLPAF